MTVKTDYLCVNLRCPLILLFSLMCLERFDREKLCSRHAACTELPRSPSKHDRSSWGIPIQHVTCDVQCCGRETLKAFSCMLLALFACLFFGFTRQGFSM